MTTRRHEFAKGVAITLGIVVAFFCALGVFTLTIGGGGGGTELTSAALRNDCERVKRALADRTLNENDDEVKDALGSASWRQNECVAMALVEKGANPFLIDSDTMRYIDHFPEPVRRKLGAARRHYLKTHPPTSAQPQ